MKELQEKLIKNLKGYSFGELEALLNKTELPEGREAILQAMELNHEEEFLKWIGE